MLKLHRLLASACHAFYNVTVDLAILIFGVWKSHRPSLFFGLANPALKIAAFAIEATEMESDIEHFSCGINLIMMYPIVGGAVVSQDVVFAARDGSVGSYLNYMFGCFYLILLRRRLQNLKSSQQNNQTKQIEEAPTFMAAVKTKVVYPEWYLHSCLYGHKGRLKSILFTCVDLDINQVGNICVLQSSLPIWSTVLSFCPLTWTRTVNGGRIKHGAHKWHNHNHACICG